MNLVPQQLDEEGFKLLDQLEHDELIPFVQQAMKYKNAYSTGYNVLVFLMLGIGVAMMIGIILNGQIPWHRAVLAFFGGASLPFLTIPIHEWIHMLAYKYVGAPRTEVYMNLKKFYFAAVADQFVTNRKEFKIIALAPFIVLSLLFTVPIFLLSTFFQLLFLGALLSHVLTCSGDFALLSYFQFHKEKEVVTYDDVAAKITYFYAR